MTEPDKCTCGKYPQQRTQQLPKTRGPGMQVYWHYRCDDCVKFGKAGTSPQEAATNWNEKIAREKEDTEYEQRAETNYQEHLIDAEAEENQADG